MDVSIFRDILSTEVGTSSNNLANMVDFLTGSTQNKYWI